MTDHYAGAAEQLSRDLARVKDERLRLRREVSDLREKWSFHTAVINEGDRIMAAQEVEIKRLRAQLAEAQAAIRALAGVPREGDPPTEPAAVVASLSLVRWLSTLDEAPSVAAAMGTVTLTQVCNKAREALSRRWSGPTLPPPTGEVP